MSTLRVVAVCLGLASGTETSTNIKIDFDAYVRLHNRNYQHGTAEYTERRFIFERRLAEVENQNAKLDGLWTAALNSYSDRTDSELKAMRGYKTNHVPGTGSLGPHGGLLTGSAARPSFFASGPGHMTGRFPSKSPPRNISWTKLHVADTIADQGACGSCWAVTATSVLNAHYEIHMGGAAKLFAAQEIVSCVPNPRHCGGKGGCDGSTVELAMQWVIDNGLKTENQISYEAKDLPCDRKNNLAKHHDSAKEYSIGLIGYETLPSNKEAPLVKAISELGPVAISVAADAWFAYSSGIFDSCSKDAVVDHAVTLYGYGVDGNHKYWLIRNSWGENWGEKGYIRLFRNDNEDSHCGTDNDPQKGLACEGGPSSVTTCGSCGMLYDSVVPHFSGSASKAQINFEPDRSSVKLHAVAKQSNRHASNQANGEESNEAEYNVEDDVDIDEELDASAGMHKADPREANDIGYDAEDDVEIDEDLDASVGKHAQEAQTTTERSASEDTPSGTDSNVKINAQFGHKANITTEAIARDDEPFGTNPDRSIDDDPDDDEVAIALGANAEPKLVRREHRGMS